MSLCEAAQKVSDKEFAAGVKILLREKTTVPVTMSQLLHMVALEDDLPQLLTREDNTMQYQLTEQNILKISRYNHIPCDKAHLLFKTIIATAYKELAAIIKTYRKNLSEIKTRYHLELTTFYTVAPNKSADVSHIIELYKSLIITTIDNAQIPILKILSLIRDGLMIIKDNLSNDYSLPIDRSKHTIKILQSTYDDFSKIQLQQLTTLSVEAKCVVNTLFFIVKSNE